MKTTTIGILGASGQVGTEVCLYLKTYPNIRPIAIVRSAISGALLRRLGVEVRYGSLGSPENCAELLKNCDVVVDFSVPAGAPGYELKAHYLNNIPKALQFSPAGAQYVFISTINAFGMNEQSNRAKYHWLPGSIYAHTKRYGERMAFRLGKKYGKKVFVFRLGHVHGLLQRVSAETADLVRNYRSFRYPATPSYTVFCYTIAEAIVAASENKGLPGVYTMVSNPPWSWKEVLEYYSPDGQSLDVNLESPARGNLPARTAAAVKRAVIRGLHKYKDTIRANVLIHFPKVDSKGAAYLYTMRARSQIRKLQDQLVYCPSGIHEGVFPGKRFPGLSDSRKAMAGKKKEVEEMIAKIT